MELEDDGDGFRANPAESLRGGDFKVGDLLDKVVSCGEAGGRACSACACLHPAVLVVVILWAAICTVSH